LVSISVKADEALILDVFSGRHLPKMCANCPGLDRGHQFGHFNKLGDGRAILIGEHVTPKNERVDIQLRLCNDDFALRRWQCGAC
jgi:uncharacterized protein YdiU (UPF0061 family)